MKLYGIGKGYWCWQLVDDMILFEDDWGNDFYNEGTYLTLESFYSEDRCYDKEDVYKIHALPVGACWTCPDYETAYTVTRVT